MPVLPNHDPPVYMNYDMGFIFMITYSLVPFSVNG